jgi:RNA polymerase sigma factor (sigma-70 family)
MMQPPRDTAPGPACRTADAAAAAGLTDGQLLERFVTRHEEAAFEALLRRHGPMVLGVCRRILHDGHEAGDAFQATFLLLVRKAASIAKKESVGSWLHGVAYRIAVKAKARADRRHARERQMMDTPTAQPFDEILWRDLRRVLDDEVDRLPEQYRAPVVLCHLEGKSYAEAARQLGCSKGAIALRLARARDLLHERLSRRGVTLSVGPFVAQLTPDRVSVPVPPALAKATARAALLRVMEKKALADAAPAPAALTGGALSALGWTKLKVAVAALLAVSVLGAGMGVCLHRLLAERPAQAGSDTPGPKKGRKTLADRLDGLPPGK